MKKGGMKINTLINNKVILLKIFKLCSIHLNIETSNANDQNAANPKQTITNVEEEEITKVQDATETAVEAEKKTIIDHPEEEQDHVHLVGLDRQEIEVTDTKRIIVQIGIDVIMIGLIGMVEIIIETIEIENTENVIVIIDHPDIMRAAETTTEPKKTIASNSSQKKRFIHISSAKRKIRMPSEKTECSGMDFNGSKKHKGNMILSNLILLFRKTKKASRKRRGE